MLHRIHQKIEALKEEHRFWRFFFLLLSLTLVIFIGSKIAILAYLLINRFYVPFIMDPLSISYYNSVIFIIPIIEELLKVGTFYFFKWFRKPDKKELIKKRLYVILGAYAFQVIEAFFYKRLGQETWWLRLFSPSHFVFTFTASYCLLTGILLHMLWNTASLLLGDFTQIAVFVLMYVIFLVYLYLKRSDFLLLRNVRKISD